MRKIFLKSLLTICTLVVTLASCNNENDVPEVPQKIGNVFMKLNLGQKADTRANEAPLAAGTTATVNSLHIYFYDNAGYFFGITGINFFVLYVSLRLLIFALFLCII